jgi:hypothetical protein
MFQDDLLKNHLERSPTIKSQSAVIAEWNMNLAENIFVIGNYRYRPNDPTIPKYQTLVNTFDEYDEAYFYTAATDADTVVDGGLDDQDIPTLFRSKKEKENILYSLEECFNRFRPRSGINKTRFLETTGQYIHHSNPEMARRPRYYMADKEDKFNLLILGDIFLVSVISSSSFSVVVGFTSELISSFFLFLVNK